MRKKGLPVLIVTAVCGALDWLILRYLVREFWSARGKDFVADFVTAIWFLTAVYVLLLSFILISSGSSRRGLKRVAAVVLVPTLATAGCVWAFTKLNPEKTAQVRAEIAGVETRKEENSAVLARMESAWSGRLALRQAGESETPVLTPPFTVVICSTEGLRPERGSGNVSMDEELAEKYFTNDPREAKTLIYIYTDNKTQTKASDMRWSNGGDAYLNPVYAVVVNEEKGVCYAPIRFSWHIVVSRDTNLNLHYSERKEFAGDFSRLLNGFTTEAG